MEKQSFSLVVALFLSFAVTVTAQDTPLSEYTSRREVLQDEALRQDFTLQGEYLAKSGNGTMGLHLIADGGGKFRTVAYSGGLPGDGWKAGEPRLYGTAEVNGDEIAFDMTVGKIVIERAQGGEGTRPFRLNPVKVEIATPALLFEKQYRQSPTLGEKAPEGAVVIFDGTNLDKFDAGAKMNETQRGNTLWAEARALPFEKKPYKLHVEFMLSYMPQARGQQRSNSGVYLDERYECQILDSFGLEGENNECGGFYLVAKPIVNMCFPPLVWQTYDFDFTPAKYEGDTKVANARVTVKHNGILIHDDIEFQQETPGYKKEGAEPLGVYLQGHGNKVQFRNIWLNYVP